MQRRRLAVGNLYGDAVDLTQQVVQVRRNVVDHVLLQGIAGLQIGALAYGLLGPVGVTAALVCERADASHSIVGDFGSHFGRHLRLAALAVLGDRRSRADVRSWRHSNDL